VNDKPHFAICLFSSFLRHDIFPVCFVRAIAPPASGNGRWWQVRLQGGPLGSQKQFSTTLGQQVPIVKRKEEVKNEKGGISAAT
jgi:hypothetical protein